ncbi:MAG: YidC/Oxa1 family membrane protein insertase, partial [Bacteroidales bacterium]|nr:YidC/Oxa1 family membrane protein insertase [Bacteroidales bacterium]
MFNVLYTIIIYPITQIIEFVFVFSLKIFKETGIAIIFISFAISLLCLPLYNIAEKWQELERNTQKKLNKKIAKIKSVFKGDERFLILSTYYRQNHYHPVYSLRSTFGLLIQIPFFIAAYTYLSHLDSLKGISLFIIPDLGSPDAILKIGNIHINILPILMTIINCIAGAIYTKEFPVKDKIQLYGMALVFLILLYSSPAGLVLYWTMNNVFSLIKNLYFKISFKYKHHLLLLVFSLFCLFLSFYCLFHFDHIKAKIIAAFFIICSTIPWLGKVLLKILPFKEFLYFEQKKSFIIYIFSFLSICILFGMFLPSQLIASSPQEFSFMDNHSNPLYFVYNTFLQSFGLFIFWTFCIYFLFSDRVRNYLSLTSLLLSLIFLSNVFLFPGKYGVISVSMVFANGVNHNVKDVLINAGALIIFLLLALVLYNRYKKTAIFILALCVFSLFSISVINIVTINREFTNLKQYYIKQQDEPKIISPIINLSKNGKNIVIIMLDRAISVFVPYIFDEYPELQTKYSGFTFYPNTVSFNGYTRIGSPPIFGGYEATPEEINKKQDVSLVKKHNQALLMLPRLLSENNFSVVVTDPPYANYNNVSDLSIYEPYKNVKAYITDSVYTNMWIKENKLNLPSQSTVLKRNILWYSIFKGIPLAFRQGIYMFGNWCSPSNNNSLRLTLNGYSVLDYLPRLTSINNEKKNNLLVMVNNTTHEGSMFQAPEYRPVLNVTNYGTGPFRKETAYHINAAALMRLAEWFDFLKKENVYDNTRIILVSDHGPESKFTIKADLPFNIEQFNSLLLVKDFDSIG